VKEQEHKLMDAPSSSPSSTDSSKAPRPNRRGIYLLPNLFTTGALFAGFYAIVAAVNQRFELAAIAVFIAMVLDGLDGRIARMTHTQSAFGAEYDSLSDLVSFGLAPALIMYQWALVHMQDMGVVWGKTGWLAAFIYVACAALRLARFNTQVATNDKKYFQGLPSPAAAAVMAGMVWVLDNWSANGTDFIWLALGTTIIVGLLMVSNISYYSFKDLDVKNQVPSIAILLMALLIALTTLDPAKVLFAVFFLYTISGPIIWVLRKYRKYDQRQIKKT
jgi:CDP-diacylglycerol--serine O-phosphatidyltransferase